MDNDSQAAKLIKAFEKQNDDDDDLDDIDDEDQETKALEDLANTTNNYSQISYWFKLFDIVTSANPG